MKTYPRVIELFKKDIDAGKSVNFIVKKTKLNHNTIGSYLEGRSEPTQRSLEMIAQAYGRTVSWLRGDIDEEKIAPIPHSPGMIPVVSKGQGGSKAFWEDAYPVGQGMKDIHRPYDVADPNAFALEVEGDSMSPKFDEGDIVVVAPSKQVVNGDYAVVKLADGQVMVKRLRFTNDIVILESVNPAFEPVIIKRSDIDFMYKVVWSKMRG